MKSQLTDIREASMSANPCPVVDLQERTCSGGCGRKFRVTESSPHRTFFSDCEQRCRKVAISKDAHKKNFNPAHGRPSSGSRSWLNNFKSIEKEEVMDG